MRESPLSSTIDLILLIALIGVFFFPAETGGLAAKIVKGYHAGMQEPRE